MLNNRFSCPSMSEVDPEDVRHVFDHVKQPKIGAASTGFQFVVEPTILRIWSNHDMGVSHEMWAVSLLVRQIGDDTIMRLQSLCPVQEGDEAEEVGWEFAAHMIHKFTEDSDNDR